MTCSILSNRICSSLIYSSFSISIVLVGERGGVVDIDAAIALAVHARRYFREQFCGRNVFGRVDFCDGGI